MVVFNLWAESFIFCSVYAILVLVPCILVAIMGKNMINKLGQYPSRTPAIQMGVFLRLISLEVVTFGLLIGFYHIFSG